ncbi:hypothetical protein BDQ17DRAFT_1421365 [Cyathus striatus]|nr:hypothetical protein BDQ17DRAFT_1421365 [Cyathus striatus]
MSPNPASTFGDAFMPATLPNGRIVKNRLVKVAMYEHLANLFGGPPNQYHYNLYSHWASYGWGMIITGNVQVSRKHCTLGRDMIVPGKITNQSLEPFQRLALCMKVDPTTREPSGSLAIMQLNHGGRQSSNVLGGRLPFESPMAPSPIRVGSRNESVISRVIHAILFQTPREMTLEDIDEVVASFVKGAKVALDSGFDGIQLHAAHGYLLAQFISPKSNSRSDQFSAEPKNSLRLLHRIVTEIRAVVPASFAVGIKINAADYVPHPQLSHEDGDRAVDHICAITRWNMIDFIEISGGDYERPDFMISRKNISMSPRQGFFSQLSHRALKSLSPLVQPSDSRRPPLILLTGGLRTPGHLQAALMSKDANLLGIGRGSVLCPNLPELVKKCKQSSDDWNDMAFSPEPDLNIPSLFTYWPICWIWNHLPKISLIGAGIEMAWYIVAMRRMASGPQKLQDKLNSNYSVGFFGAVFWMWAWVPISVVSITIWTLSIVLLVFLPLIFTGMFVS